MFVLIEIFNIRAVWCFVGMPTLPSFTPVKLELTEQLELGYLPLRDDFDRVYYILLVVTTASF